MVDDSSFAIQQLITGIVSIVILLIAIIELCSERFTEKKIGRMKKHFHRTSK